MRIFSIIFLSATVLSGCLTTQENPNYEYSTTYKGDSPAQTQYAATTPAPLTSESPSYVTYGNTYDGTYNNGAAQPVIVQANSAETTLMEAAPTDSFYNSADVSGTPGFMAMQNADQSVASRTVLPTATEVEFVSAAPLGAAGTPVDYDYARNLVSVESVTTATQIPETVRILGNADQNYTVQQGDTVYSLSRKTCVGVNVIQSMNGLNPDFAIKIGQTLTLPQPVC